MSQPVLTNHLKTQIINNALEKAGIPKRKSALRAARVEWAERVRLAAIGGVEKEAEILKIIKKIETLVSKFPEALKTANNIIRKECYMCLNLAGSRVTVYFNGNYRGYESGSPDHIHKIAPGEFTLLANDPLVTEFYGFDALYEQIQSDESDIRQNVSAALSKVRTVKRLLEEWPEAKELLPADAPSAPLPPAIRRKLSTK
ncbi:Nmad5 family putative nucleotide modification protein [Escherichia coli]|uniref:Nmad5 family putative nucleotide modification protein n=1 Tax=Escherichia coli TaxID=562 RepID=UPI002033EA5B|nr:Nmad5 family putative nucleotide modification protein [Escherichia coli]